MELDAIRSPEILEKHKENDQKIWNVAYLPIDPRDINRCYEAVVRINSQSGKGGVALVLERDFGIELPKSSRENVYLSEIISEINFKKKQNLANLFSHVSFTILSGRNATI